MTIVRQGAERLVAGDLPAGTGRGDRGRSIRFEEARDKEIFPSLTLLQFNSSGSGFVTIRVSAQSWRE